MKAGKGATVGNGRSKEKIKAAGKRSLYDPKLGSRNHLAAELGRFSKHPAFLTIRGLAGVAVALQRILPDIDRLGSDARGIKLRLNAISGQMDKALTALSKEAENLKSPGDKLRFAEAIAGFLAPSKAPDEKTWLVCWEAIQMRTRLRTKPSQAELRHQVNIRYDYIFSNQEWARLLKRTGLDRELA